MKITDFNVSLPKRKLFINELQELQQFVFNKFHFLLFTNYFFMKFFLTEKKIVIFFEFSKILYFFVIVELYINESGFWDNPANLLKAGRWGVKS